MMPTDDDEMPLVPGTDFSPADLPAPAPLPGFESSAPLAPAFLTHTESQPSSDGLFPTNPGGPANDSALPGKDKEPAKPAILADKYLLERELARGAMGRVYLATQLGLNRKVAIKVMSPKLDDPDFRRRFLLEATGLANLSHRNIVTVFDYGESKRGMLYLVLEYLEGRTLAQELKAEGTMTVARTLGITAQILRGLRAAHNKGIVHRDLKPSNIFVTRGEDGDEEVKVLDFGVAKLFDSEDVNMDATRDGMLLGTPAFMAPEQIDGARVGPGTDLYAVGCVIFNLLTGKVPFPGKNDVEILHAHLKSPAPLLRSIAGCEALPELVEAYVNRLLQKKPEDRFVDSAAALEGLRTLTSALLANDVNFRAQISPDLAAMGNTGGNSGSSHGARTNGSRPPTDTSEIARLADGSASGTGAGQGTGSGTGSGWTPPSTGGQLIPAPQTMETGVAQAQEPRRAPRGAIIGAAAALLLVLVAAPVLLTRSHRVTIETIPAGLMLIDHQGRVLGTSPVTIDTDETTLQVRARVDDELSELQELTSFDGRVLADFSAWSRAQGTDALPEVPATATAPVTATPAAAPPAATPTPARVVEPARHVSNKQAARAKPAPPPTLPVAAVPAPPPAPTRPSVGMLDDDAHFAPLDQRPGIGLLDETPKIAPID
jgi:serine/threonine protein kinase